MSQPTPLTDDGLVCECKHPLAVERARMSPKLNPVPDGWRPSLQRLYRFGSYGLSVVYDPMLHAYDFAWEVAVIRFQDERHDRFELVYDTPLTSDVEVFRTNEETNQFIWKARDYLTAHAQEAA